jgi:peptidoglycan/xylan/chitin deacetylase (PgdA/CDA1 family)
MAASQLVQAAFKHLRVRPGGVPVFLFHGLTNSEGAVASSRERDYWIRGARFREHLNQIRRSGYRAWLLEELWHEGQRTPSTSASHGNTWQASRVALTFDDGLTSAYEIAYPLLLEAGVRADFFVNTASIGKPGFLSWAQILEMQRAGMSFQSHSHEHVYLTRLPASDLEGQLRDSKRILENRLGKPVVFLSVPYGELDGRVTHAARYLGYRAVCSSWSWPARPGAPVVGRVIVNSRTTLGDFQRLLTGNPIAYVARAARGCLKYFPKRLLLRFRPGLPPSGYVPPVAQE